MNKNNEIQETILVEIDGELFQIRTPETTGDIENLFGFSEPVPHPMKIPMRSLVV